MRVVHVLASASGSWGGPPRVVRDLTHALAPLGVDNVVVALKTRGSFLVEFSGRTKLIECGTAAIPKLAIPASMNLVRKLTKEIESADLVHIHELWHFPHVTGALISLALDRPYVITPHGELQPWPMTQHKFLKKIAWHAYEKQILSNSYGIHVLTPLEREAIEALSPGLPISIIPNGIDLGLIDSALATVPDLGRAYSGIAGPYILFVGRLAPEKGLRVLLEAFSLVHQDMKDVRLLMAGTDELGLWGGLELQARGLGISQSVRDLGTVREPDKYRLFASARAFVLSSASDGVRVALLEALACGTPAIISTGCNLPEVETEGAGRVVEPIARLFAEAISDMLRDRALSKTMGINARKLAGSRFSVRSMASRMLGFYREALAHRPKGAS